MNLDNHNHLKSLDTQNFIHDIDTLPDQVAAGWKLSQLFKLPNNHGAITNVILAGMGGSAIGGALTQALVTPESRVPVTIWRDYNLPAFAGLNTLVICSSYSGNTEETLSACEAALARGTKLLVITAGGKLAALAEKQGAPIWCFQHRGQPRAAVGLSFMFILAALTKLGLVSDKSADVVEAVHAMRQQQASLRADVATVHNPAKHLAGQLVDRLGMIVAAEYLAPVARRWKGQITRVAKSNAVFDELPEMSHNIATGLAQPKALVSKHLVIFLRSRHDQPRNRLRSELTRGIYLKAGFNTEVIEAAGQSPLANMLTTLHYGDYVAYYLAMAYDTDPSPLSQLDHTHETFTYHEASPSLAFK